jgi:hypothetical protein
MMKKTRISAWSMNGRSCVTTSDGLLIDCEGDRPMNSQAANR